MPAFSAVHLRMRT